MARLLLRRDTQETVLFVDRAYFEGAKDQQAQDLLRQQVRSWVAAPPLATRPAHCTFCIMQRLST